MRRGAVFVAIVALMAIVGLTVVPAIACDPCADGQSHQTATGTEKAVMAAEAGHIAPVAAATDKEAVGSTQTINCGTHELTAMHPSSQGDVDEAKDQQQTSGTYTKTAMDISTTTSTIDTEAAPASVDQQAMEDAIAQTPEHVTATGESDAEAPKTMTAADSAHGTGLGSEHKAHYEEASGQLESGISQLTIEEMASITCQGAGSDLQAEIAEKARISTEASGDQQKKSEVVHVQREVAATPAELTRIAELADQKTAHGQVAVITAPECGDALLGAQDEVAALTIQARAGPHRDQWTVSADNYAYPGETWLAQRMADAMTVTTPGAEHESLCSPMDRHSTDQAMFVSIAFW